MAEQTDGDGRDTTLEAAMVPSARLREETASKRKALARVAELESVVEDHEKRLATTDSIARTLEDLRATRKAELEAWETERAVYQIGLVDPEAIEVARHLHGRLPADKRPPLADWLRGLREDLTQAPRALRPYLETGPPSGDGPAAPAESSRLAPARPPAQRAGGRAPGPSEPGAASQYSAEQIRAIREECVRTGNWKPYEAIRETLLGSLR